MRNMLVMLMTVSLLGQVPGPSAITKADGPRVWIAKKGDSLAGIARDHGIPFGRVLAWNSALTSRDLWEGDKVFLSAPPKSPLPSGSSVVPPALGREVGAGKEKKADGRPLILSDQAEAEDAAPDASDLALTLQAKPPSSEAGRGSGQAMSSLVLRPATALRRGTANNPAYGKALLEGHPWGRVLKENPHRGQEGMPILEALQGLPVVDADFRPASEWTPTQVMVMESIEKRRVAAWGYLKHASWRETEQGWALVVWVTWSPQAPLAQSVVVTVPGEFLPPIIDMEPLRRCATLGTRVALEGVLAYNNSAIGIGRDRIGPWGILAAKLKISDGRGGWMQSTLQSKEKKN